MTNTSPSSSPIILKLSAVDATPESFAPFGQLISASPDGQPYGPHDAQLDLNGGIPRFHIMRLEDQELKFSNITHHANVTQCLGSIGGGEWYLGVAKASVLDEHKLSKSGTTPLKSRRGHYYTPPHPDDVVVFRISGPKFLKLNVGTWHAGPMFKNKSMDFYNLELSDTNETDFSTHNFLKKDGVTFLIE